MTEAVTQQNQSELAEQDPGPIKSIRRRRIPRLGCAVVLLLFLLVTLVLAFKAVRLGMAGRVAVDELRTLQTLDVASLSNLDASRFDELRTSFGRLEQALATIEAEAGPALPLARHLGGLPRFGPETQAAPDLLRLAGSTATAGRAAMDGMVPILEAYKQGGGKDALARLAPAVAAAAPSWQEAQIALDEASAARSNIDVSTLDPRIAGLIERLDQYLPLLDAGANLAQVAPSLLGAEGSRTYLLLAQNSDELRPTGGFITGVGLTSVDRGELGVVDFKDSYTVYTNTVDHPLAPPDLQTYMGAQLLLFRDANWTPDYPTASAVAQALYQLNNGVHTDGVIAFDLEAARRVVAVLEPLNLPGYEEPVTSANLITAMRQVWGTPAEVQDASPEQQASQWWKYRKDFMGDLAGAARAKIESGQVDFGKLAQAVYGALQEKHILLNLNDPQVMETIENLGWNGSLQPGNGDFLMVVDSNVGWNKVNGLVDRATSYRITPKPEGGAEALLELTYTHRGTPMQDGCRHEPRYGDTYDDMLRRCYFNYLRVYVPGGAQLLASDGFEPDTAATLPGEKGASVLAGYLIVPPGQSRTVTLRYELPPSVMADSLYRLRIQKQPGTPTRPVELDFDGPGGPWQIVSPDSELLQTTGANTATVQLQRDVDLEFPRR